MKAFSTGYCFIRHLKATAHTHCFCSNECLSLACCMKRCHLGLFDDNFNLSVNIYFCAHIETQGYGKESFMQGQREKERHGAAVTHFFQKEKKEIKTKTHT